MMGVPATWECNYAALVRLTADAGWAISRLKEIHPPAHMPVARHVEGMLAQVC